MNTIETIQQALDYIEDHILEDVSSDEIARQVFMSSHYFQRMFSFLCGITLAEYIRNRRLTLAGEEIKNSDRKIIDIAFKYGYETPESFSRAFSRFHNISPTMARNQGEINSFARISVQTILEGMIKMEERIKQRGYTVAQVGPVYLTTDMDKTVEWFEHILGWYASVETRDKDGKAIYGCAMPFNGELVHLGVTSFNGLFLHPGEAKQSLISLAGVQGIDNLYAYVKKNGWDQISEVVTQPWGAKVCDVTTIDGCVLRFFESI